MYILGIESSCDETAISVVEDGRKILSNAVETQIERHREFGGVVPEIASRMHTEAICGVYNKALSDAHLNISDISAVAVTFAPGLIGALLVGVNFAKGLCLASGKPLIPVHHLRAHIAANYITYKELEPPFLCLVVSGGNTMLVNVKSYTEFEIIGRTRDDAAGECMDKVARAMSLSYPGGVNLDRLSKNGNPEAFRFPKPKVDNSPLDFSFSGLKTNAVNLLNSAKQKCETLSKEDFGASFINSVSDSLIENTEKAIDITGLDKLVLAGGVSANSVLRKKAEALAKCKGIKLYLPDLSLCGDNAAMVAAQGFYEYMNGALSDMSLNAYPTMDIDKIRY